MEPGFYKEYFELEKDNWWFKVRRNLIFLLLKKYNRRLFQETKIFDFGCGSGFLVGELQKKGYQSFGTDMSTEAIEYGTKHGIDNLSVAKDGRINFPDNNFDVVLALDVLEHLEDERPAIKEIDRVLKSGGVAIITVPAYMFLWGVQDEVSHHYRRYLASGLIKKFKENSSLKLIKKSYFNTILFLPIALVRLLAKLLPKPKRESDFEIENKLINWLFYYIFNLETSYLKHFSFPFGVSILLVLKKDG